MRRRELLKTAGAAALAAPFVHTAIAQPAPVKVGVIGAKTGPLAPGAAVTHFPSWRLWAHEVNSKGGLKLKDGQRKVELIEYDDRTAPPEAIKAIERLVSVNQVDWIMGLYGTGFNIAAVPTFAKYGFPQVPQACVTELGPELIKKYPQLFFANGSVSQYCTTAIDILKKQRDAGVIGKRVAMVNIADEFGIEIANLARKAFPEAGFEIVLNRSYPLGTQDYAALIKAAKASNPDVFIAWSYPPDTFGLAEQAKIEDLNVKVYYSCVGCSFPLFSSKFGSAAENILGAGGIPDNEKTRAFYKLHKEVTGVDADYWGSPMYYALGQLLTQAFEGAGTMDREAITTHLKNNTYQTMIGEVDLRSQMINKVYTAGQWQNGFFKAVAGVGFSDSDFVPIKVKTSWDKRASSRRNNRGSANMSPIHSFFLTAQKQGG